MTALRTQPSRIVRTNWSKRRGLLGLAGLAPHSCRSSGPDPSYNVPGRKTFTYSTTGPISTTGPLAPLTQRPEYNRRNRATCQTEVEQAACHDGWDFRNGQIGKHVGWGGVFWRTVRSTRVAGPWRRMGRKIPLGNIRSPWTVFRNMK